MSEQRTICYLCEQVVESKRLILHWRDECVKSYVRVAPTPPLLDRVWEQIDDILVEQKFAR